LKLKKECYEEKVDGLSLHLLKLKREYYEENVKTDGAFNPLKLKK
jgi:hypothetical protein